MSARCRVDKTHCEYLVQQALDLPLPPHSLVLEWISFRTIEVWFTRARDEDTGETLRVSDREDVLEWTESDGCDWPLGDRVRHVKRRARDPSKELLNCRFIVYLVNRESAEFSMLWVETLTFTVPPDATASIPFWLHSSSADPPLVVHCLTAPFQFRQSHTFTVPS